MRLTCPNCKAEYEVADNAIPPQGRDVQCSSCGHAWFERPRLIDDLDPAEPAPAPVEAEEETVEAAQRVPRRELDPSVAEILRAEATREARERREEAETTLESQEEFAFASEPPPKGPDPDDETLTTARLSPAPKRTSEVPRRDLLPDIEEINSSLRAKSVLRSGAAAALTEEEREERARRGRGFRIGFSSILLVALFAVLLYSYADLVMESVPVLRPAVEGYVAQINALRVWLDGQMANGASAISSVLQGANN